MSTTQFDGDFPEFNLQDFDFEEFCEGNSINFDDFFNLPPQQYQTPPGLPTLEDYFPGIDAHDLIDHYLIDSGIRGGAGTSGLAQRGLYFVDGHPDLVVRHDGPEKPQHIAEAAQVYFDLPGHGIETLPFLPVTYNDSLYVFTHRVEGTPLHTLLEMQPTPDLLRLTDELYVNHHQYLLNHEGTDQPVASDIYGTHQSMYGTTATDPNPKVWMVDLDVSTTRAPAYNFNLEDYLIDLANDIVQIERTTSAVLHNARSVLGASLHPNVALKPGRQALLHLAGFILATGEHTDAYWDLEDDELISLVQTLASSSLEQAQRIIAGSRPSRV